MPCTFLFILIGFIALDNEMPKNYFYHIVCNASLTFSWRQNAFFFHVCHSVDFSFGNKFIEWKFCVKTNHKHEQIIALFWGVPKFHIMIISVETSIEMQREQEIVTIYTKYRKWLMPIRVVSAINEHNEIFLKIK